MRIILSVLVFFLAAPMLAQEQTIVAMSTYNWRHSRTPAFPSGILVDPANDDIWYVSSPEGLFITRNGGTSWSQALIGELAPEAVAIDPTNANRLYAAVNGALFTSANKGVSWSETYKFSSQTVSFAIGFRDGALYAGPRFADGFNGIYKSTNGGVSFSSLSFGSAVGRSSVIDIETDSTGCIYSIAESSAAGAGALLQSCDNGTTWSSILGSLLALPSKLAWNPAYRLLFASGSRLGLHVTADGGKFWGVYTYRRVSTFLPVSGPDRMFLSLSESGWEGIHTQGLLRTVSPNLSPAAPFSAGLSGEFTMIAVNSAQTKIFVTSASGLVWTGDMQNPSLTSRAVYVRPGSELALICEFCSTWTTSDLEVFSRTIRSADPYELKFPIPADVAPGVYPARFVAPGFWNLPFDLVVGDPAPRISRLTTARFGQKPAFARGEIVSVFGVNFNGALNQPVSPANVARYVPWETDVSLSRISVDGEFVPVQFSMTNRSLVSQINFQIPPRLSEGTHSLRVHRLDSQGNTIASSAPFSFTVRSTSPTYLGNEGIPLFVQNLTQDPSGNVFVTGGTPAFPGDVAVLYATGLGATSPPVPIADVPPPGVTANVLLPIAALARSGSSEWTVEILGAAASPQFPGLYQIAIRFPLDARPAGGTVDLVLSAGDDIQSFKLNFSTRN